MLLSVLDPSPVFEGRTAQDALNETRALANLVDKLGYNRYWLQEHHNSSSFAGTAPEVLIPALAEKTRQIKLGSGGVMLPNYSPLKVAEQFSVLSSLYPNRIEIGIGRATGADPRTSAALLGPGAKEFPQMLNLLLSWLLDASGEAPLPDNHPAKGIKAMPGTPTLTDVIVLSSSPQSAAFAGAMGLKLAFADFLSPGGAHEAIAAYKKHFEPSAFNKTPHAILALVTLACETDSIAEQAASTARAWALYRAQGQFPPFLNPENARALLDQVGDTPLRQMVEQRAIVGTKDVVRDRLNTVQAESDADELMLLTIAHDPVIRQNSYQLLAA